MKNAVAVSAALERKPANPLPGLVKKTDKAAHPSIGFPNDKVNVSFNTVSKNLNAMVEEILRKLNEILAEDLPQGVQSLAPEEHTPEKSSERIVNGVMALLPAYARQNKDLEGEELISSFMKTVRGGIEKGYKQASTTLGDIGALEVEGVQAGIEETMRLVDEKLSALAEQLIGKDEQAPVEESEAKPEEVSA